MGGEPEASGVGVVGDADDGFAVALAVQVGQAVDRPGEEPPEHAVDRRRVLPVGARHVRLLRLVVGVRHPPQRRAEHDEEEGPLGVAAVEPQDRLPERLHPSPLPGAEPVAEAGDVGHRGFEPGGRRPPPGGQFAG